MQLPSSIEELADLIDEHGPDKVAKRFRKPPISSQLLRAYSHEPPSEEGWMFLAQYALTPSSLLEEMANAPDSFPAKVLGLVAQNQRTPPNALSEFARHALRDVRAAVAENPNLAARDIELLLENADTTLWSALAVNPSLKLKTQAYLAAHGDAATRLALTQNKSLHPDLWVALSSDPSPLVRFTLAAASHAPDDLLPFWADSDREEIQLALLTRRSLPDKIRQALIFSPHASVRQAVIELAPPDEVELLHLSQVDDAIDREYVSSLEHVPAALQHELAQDSDVAVRQALASNESIWPEVAEFFVTGEDEEACLTLLDNPAMPEALYVELAWLNNPRITAVMASSERTPAEVLQYLINERMSAVAIFHFAASGQNAPWLRADLANALAGLPSPSLRALAANAPQLPASARNRLRDDPAPRVRHAASELPPGLELEEVQLPAASNLDECLRELNALIHGESLTAEADDEPPFQNNELNNEPTN